MGGGEHPQGAAGRGGGGLLRAQPVGHQPHQELVGPGYAQGRRSPLSPDTETENSPTVLCCVWICGPRHPCPRGAPLTPAARLPHPAPLWIPSPGGSRSGSAAVRTRPPRPRPPHGWRGAHLVDAQHGAPEGAAQPAQLGPQRLQMPGPEGRGRLVELTTERGCHGVDDHQAGHTPRQQHRHLLTHALQQGVLEAEGRWPSPPPRGGPLTTPRPGPSQWPGPSPSVAPCWAPTTRTTTVTRTAQPHPVEGGSRCAGT